jgi:ribulose-phosphate 3-epimerase
MSFVTPAVLPTSKESLEEKLARLATIPEVDRIQIDVVDGKFVTPMSWPYTAPQELNDMVTKGEMLPNLERIAYEVDLMCLDPERAADAWLALGASRLTFHAESIIDLSRFLTSIRARYGCDDFSCDLISIGLAINLESDLALFEPYLGDVDYVQFMGIARIGRQGQPFDKRVLNRVRVFCERHPNIAVQVDGGVSIDTARDIIDSGASNLIIGSAILRADDPAAAVTAFQALER